MLYAASPEFLTSVREFMAEHHKDARELAGLLGYSARKVQQVLHGEPKCSKTFETKFDKLKTRLERVTREAETKSEEDTFTKWLPIVCSHSEGKFTQRLISTRATKRVGHVNPDSISAVPKQPGIYEWAVNAQKSELLVMYVGKSKDLRRRICEYVYSAKSHKRREFDNLMDTSPIHKNIRCVLWFRYQLVPEPEIDAVERAHLKRYEYPWNKMLNTKQPTE